MEITVKVCDICQDPQGRAQTYTVSREGASVRVDLCPDHSGALEAFLARETASQPKPKKKASRKPRSTRVRTMEEIQAEKIFSG